jgi:predicted GNAT family N-acyltransferase
LLYTQIKFDTNQYWQAVRMREVELRLPLGMRYTAEALASEESEIVFCAIENEKIVASCQFIIENNKAKMRQVATKKSEQGKGIGRDLFLYSMDWFNKNGYDMTEVYCHARVSAVPFYLGLGFEIYSEAFEEVGISHVKMRIRFAIFTMI